MAPEIEQRPEGEAGESPAPEIAPPRRRGRGCLRGIFRMTRTTAVILLILLGAGWYWLENGSIGEYIADQISTQLEQGLGRDVAVGRVSIRPSIPPRIIVRDIRVANVSGASSPDFIRVGRIDVTGIVRSIVERKIDLGTIRIQDVSVSIEKMPATAGGGLNIPTWTSKDDSAMPEVDIRRILLNRASVEYVDRDAGVRIALAGADAQLRPGLRLESLRAILERGELRVDAGQIHLPPLRVDAEVSGDKKALKITSVAARNTVLEVVGGGLVSFTDPAATDIGLHLRAELARLRAPLGLPPEKSLEGRVVSSITIRGGETSQIAGTFHSAALRYDIYKAQKLDGHFRIASDAIEVALDKARFAGGAAKVSLKIPSGEADNVFEVEHDGVRVEQLLGVWGVGTSGLMGHADGKLVYHWRGKDVLGGSGEGTAEIEVERDGTTRALYAVPVEGNAIYRIENRKLLFDPLRIDTGATSATITGGFALETLDTSITAEIRARDIRELDRIAADIARSLGEKDWKLLGIAGDGTIRAKLEGKLTRPLVDGKIEANGFRWAGVELGKADVDLQYDTVAGRIHFRRALFQLDGGTLSLRDDIGLPPGEEPTFSLVVEVKNYSASRVLDAIALKLPIQGLATGGLRVTGRPSRGSILFESLEITDAGSQASLDGTIGWLPGKNGLELDCRIGLRGLPVAKAWAFFSEGAPPIGGALTGTMSLEGRIAELRGRGSIALRGAKLANEPIENASVEIEFDKGSMRARHLNVQLAAGRLEGEGSFDIAAGRFDYVLHSPGIELSKLKAWPDLHENIDGTLVITSSGAGELKHPEFVFDARLEKARLLGIEAGPDDPPTTIFASLTPQGFKVDGHFGRFGQIGGAGTINTVTGEVGGTIRAVVDAGAPIFAKLSSRYDLETSGNATLELVVAGNVNEPAKLSVKGRILDVDVAAGTHRIQSPKPATFSLLGGVMGFEEFEVLFDEKPFRVGGTVSLAENRIDLDVDGTVSAELLTYVLADFRLNGAIKIAINVRGALDAPKVSGNAEMRGGEIRIRDIPQPFKDVDLALVIGDRGIKIDAFSATVGSGKIVAGGSIDLDAAGKASVRVSVRGEDFSARITPNVTIGGDCDLIVTGSPSEKLRVNGTVTLDKALYTKKVDINKAITSVFLDRKVSVDSIAAPWQEAVLLGIDVKFDQRAIAVHNNLADITGTGELRVTGSLARPVAVGRIAIDEGGTFELRDVEYRVARGSIDFQNPFRTDPYIDISAEGRYQNEYDITVSLNGTLDRLESTVTSDPPVDDLSLLSLLGGGFAQPSSSSSTSNAFSDAKNSLVDASVGGVLSSTVPFADSVRIEGLSSDKPKVTLDKAISRELRAIVSYTLDEKGEDVEIVEWRVSDNLVLQFTRDSTKEASFLINAVDLTFRRRFAGRW